MITLFRRIRQKLIDSGSVSKYLLYAVGEILLVVIGILIALQVSNWKEERQLRSQEKIYLELIRDDLMLQKEENGIQRSAIMNHLSVREPLTKLISERFQVRVDQRVEVKRILSALLVGRTYGAYEATFLDLTSSGNIGLISDQSLKNQIIQHYQIQRRDRDVINNNTLNTYLELWTKLVDRDLIMVAPNMEKFIMDDNALEYDPALDFLDDHLFENLSEEGNMMLIQNVLAFKVTSGSIAILFLDNSNDRIDGLIKAIDQQIEAF